MVYKSALNSVMRSLKTGLPSLLLDSVRSERSELKAAHRMRSQLCQRRFMKLGFLLDMALLLLLQSIHVVLGSLAML